MPVNGRFPASTTLKEEDFLTSGTVMYKNETSDEERHLLTEYTDKEEEVPMITMDDSSEIGTIEEGAVLDSVDALGYTNAQHTTSTQNIPGTSLDTCELGAVGNTTPGTATDKETASKMSCSNFVNDAIPNNLKTLKNTAHQGMKIISSCTIPGPSNDPCEGAAGEILNKGKRKSVCLPIAIEDGTECILNLATGDPKEYVQIREGDKVVIYKKLGILPENCEEDLTEVVTDTGQGENIEVYVIGGTTSIDQQSGISTPREDNPDNLDKKQLTEAGPDIRQLLESLLQQQEKGSAQIKSLGEALKTQKPKRTRKQKIIYYGKKVGAVVSFAYAVYSMVGKLVDFISQHVS